MNDIVHYLLGSVNTFLDPDPIINEFLSSEGGPDVLCTYSEAKGFDMQCPRSGSDAKFASLLDTVKRYIDAQSKEEADVFETSKLVRRPSANIERPVFDHTNDTTTSYEADCQSEPGSHGVVGPQLIEHESIVKRWTAPDDLTKDMNVLREIGNTTGCRVEYDGTIGQIIVRGEDADRVEKAIAKLDHVKTVKEQRETGQWNENFYIQEDETKFFLQLAVPKKLTDRQLRVTTRKHPLSYLEIIMVRWNIRTQQYEAATCQSEALLSPRGACRLWDHHVYKEFGDERSNPAHWIQGSKSSSVMSGEETMHQILPKDKFASLNQWNEKAASTMSDPFRPLNETTESHSISKSGGGNIKESPNSSKLKEYIKTRRVVKGQAANAVLAPEQSHGPASISSLVKTNLPPTPKASFTEPTAVHAVAQTSAVSEMPAKVEPPPIQGPYLPNEAHTPPSPCARNEHWKGNIVRRIPVNPLLAPAVKNVNATGTRANGIIENKQRTTELETRQYQRGSNLKAAQKTSRAKVDDTVVSKVIGSAAMILELVRSLPGQMDLELSLGRLYVNGTNVPSDLQQKLFPASEWSALFISHSALRQKMTMFSSLLTTSWVDAEYVLDLKLPGNQRLFSETILQSTVVYEFKCHSSKTGVEVVIAFNEDGSYNVHDTPEIIGTTNLFFPKRVWDARLSVTESKSSVMENQETFKHVIDNLYIKPGCTVPRLYTKTASSTIEIQSIVVKRQTRHSCNTYPDLVLQLTECVDLIIQKSSPRHYQAFALTPAQMVADENRLWWEVSIRSMAAQEILRENLDLEVGEYAKWTPQQFVDGGIIQNLYGLAKEVVTRIDNVGYNTSALKGYAGTMAQTASKRSKDESNEKKKNVFLW